MKALILVGGYGTRLRPFTFTLPKPLVPFANKPIVVHQIEALVKAGVKEIILAVNYQPAALMEFLKECEQKYGITIHFSKEDEPLGTAGPLALAKKWLQKDDSPFFMLNSDVICEFPLEDMLKFHKAHGQEGTIFVTAVEDPSKYGVVLSEGNGEIKSFIEKPKEFISDKINAGIYLFNPSICDRIELKPTSIEREIFPVMAEQKQLYSKVLEGYWMDVGQPKDFITGSRLHLDAIRRKSPADLAEGKNIRGNVLVHPTATIGEGAVIGPDVVLGPSVVVGAHSRVSNSTLMEGVKVGSASVVINSMVGWSTRIGNWARVDTCILGEDVTVKNEIVAKDVTCLLHKGIKENIYSQKIII